MKNNRSEKLYSYIKWLFFIVSIILFFVNWKFGLSLFLFSGFVFSAIPRGPNYALSAIAGFSIIIGIGFIFFNWKISALLFLIAYLVTKFRIWATDVNIEYYSKNPDPDNKR